MSQSVITLLLAETCSTLGSRSAARSCAERVLLAFGEPRQTNIDLGLGLLSAEQARQMKSRKLRQMQFRFLG